MLNMKIYKGIPIRWRMPITIIIGAALVFFIATIFLAIKIFAMKAPALSAEQKVNSVILEVGNHLILPMNEAPTVATVADPQKLRDQPFFQNAEVGDQILIYSVAKKAILWRPSVKKVVEVSSLSVAPTLENAPVEEE
jgi:hypothetical protein